MKIVIDMPEEDYINIKNAINSLIENGVERVSMSKICLAILDGTPLPKGHGRLGDLDKIANKVNALKDNWNRYGNEYESGRYESYDYAVDVIEDASTIIEADKGDRSDK